MMKTFTTLIVALLLQLAAQAQRPVLSSHTPTTGASQVLTTIPMTLTFNKAISKGSGNIYLRNRTLKSTKTIAASSSDVSVSGSFVTISNLGLIGGCYYHVTFDSTAFDSSIYHSTGLYDTSTWWFRTGGTGVGVAPTSSAPFSVELAGNNVNGPIIITCSIPTNATLSVEAYDMNGRKAASAVVSARQGKNELALLPDAPPGSYIICVNDGQNSCSLRVVKQ
jgi:hypothetical protein